MFFRHSVLKKIELEEVAAIVGSDWATVWRKLLITPRLSGRVLIGHLRIAGKEAFPIVAQMGYSNKVKVVDVLNNTLKLSGQESIEFLDCKRDRDSLIELIEERLVSYNGDDDGELDIFG